MRRTILMSASACVAVAVALWSPAARASAAASAAPPTPNLEIVIVGEQPTADLLSAAIAPLLTGIERVQWRKLRTTAPISDAGQPGVARLWIDAHRRGVVSVVGFSRGGSPRVRSVDVPELTPVVAETIAQIVHETAVTLLAEPGPAAAPAPAASGADAAASGGRAVTEAPGAPPEETLRLPAGSQASPFRMSLTLGYVWRELVGFSEHLGEGPTVSVTASYRHETVRSFAMLAFDRVQGTGAGAQITLTSVVPTLGICWRPAADFDVRTSIGAGVEHYSWLGPGWLAVSRAALSVAVPLPGGLEVALTLMVDATPHFGIDSYAHVLPAAMLAVGWYP